MERTFLSTKLQTEAAARRHSLSLLAFLLFTGLVSIAVLSGVRQVPFHPDESTFLFLSADFELLFSRPASMVWLSEQSADPVQRYRTLDAPLGRYLVGFGRWLSSLPPLPVDWDWGKTWQQNQQAGALPDSRLLLAGRYPMAGLLPVSMLLLFFTGRRLGSDLLGWVAALLLVSNALVLMLNRRAVSEGLVIFTTALMLFSMVRAKKHPWLSALPASLAFCAKHSLAALAPIGLLAIFWQPHVSFANRCKQAGLYAILYMAVLLALNPFVWAQPLAALQSAADARRELAQNQVGDRPEQALNTPGKRIIGLLGALYLTPPILAEVANYVEDTRLMDETYLANPFHSLLRSLPAGALLLVLTSFGWLAALRQVLQPAQLAGAGTDRRTLSLLLLASGLQSIALLALVPLPFQRYYLPLIPHACLWTAYGLVQVMAPLKAAVRNRYYRPRTGQSTN
jgi:hypothetical protein